MTSKDSTEPVLPFEVGPHRSFVRSEGPGVSGMAENPSPIDGLADLTARSPVTV